MICSQDSVMQFILDRFQEIDPIINSLLMAAGVSIAADLRRSPPAANRSSPNRRSRARRARRRLFPPVNDAGNPYTAVNFPRSGQQSW